MNIAIDKRPAWAAAIKKGDHLTVRAESMGRGGESGQVIYSDDEGVCLEFFCDRNGDPSGVPSQEFWEWGEIDLDIIPVI